MLVTTLFLGACGAQSKPDQGPNKAAPASEEIPDGPITAARILEFKFDPETIDVAVGATVAWTNDDPYFHTVTSGKTDGPENVPDGKFDHDVKNKGDVAKVTFDQAGTYTYYCKQHNAMNGEIRVS